MTSWRSLATILPRLRSYVARAPRNHSLVARALWIGYATLYGTSNADDLLQQAVTFDRFGHDFHDLHIVCGAAMIALQTDCAIPIWLCRPSAAKVVNETDLRAIPTEAPRMLRSPGIVEARRPESGERLWGNYVSLGWYANDSGGLMLLGLRYPEGYDLARWRPVWTGQSLKAQLPVMEAECSTIESVEQHHDFAVAAARFLVTLGLSSEAENSPLRIERDRAERQTRHVYLSERSKRDRNALGAPLVSAIQGRIAQQLDVSRHLRRQRYGAGHAQVKWMWIETYEARRWCDPRWLVSSSDDAPDTPERVQRLPTSAPSMMIPA